MQWQNPIFPASKHVFPPRFCLCSADLHPHVPKLCTDLDFGLLYILIVRTYSKFARENNFLALGVCSPQSCSSAGRRFPASRSRLKDRFVSTTKKSMKCVVHWIPLRICVRSRNTQPHLNELQLVYRAHSDRPRSRKS